MTRETDRARLAVSTAEALIHAVSTAFDNLLCPDAMTPLQASWVAQHLGQAVADAAPVVTRQHYIGRSEASNAQAERALRVLEGGRR